MSTKSRQTGVSLIELVLFIVIVGVAVAGILMVMNNVTAHSADPMLRKQAIAVADSLMEEIALHPFTYCDPADANFFTAASNGGCAVSSNDESLLVPQAGESRYNNASPYNNVGDYNAFAMTSGIYGIDNSPIAELANYNASVAITNVGTTFGLAATAVLRIVVTVTSGSDSYSLTSFRFRYAPNYAP